MIKNKLLAISASFVLAVTGAVGISAAALAASHDADCDGAAHLTSHHMSISGNTLTEQFNVSCGAPITLSLVSYQAANTSSFPGNLPQTLFDSKTQAVGQGEYTWHAALPNCYFQADFVSGGVIANLSANNRYGSRVIDTATGGRLACQNDTVTVSKSTVPAGDKTAFSITISTLDGHIFGDAAQSIMDGGKVVYTVTPGTYSVTETAVDGWTQTSNTCTDLVVGGSHVESFSHNDNDDQMGTNTNCQIVNTKNTTPVTPPAGGQGAGQVLGATTTAPAPAQQVIAPVGAVNGGEGAASKTVSMSAVLGLAVSVGAIGFGVRRLVKSRH